MRKGVEDWSELWQTSGAHQIQAIRASWRRHLGRGSRHLSFFDHIERAANVTFLVLDREFPMGASGDLEGKAAVQLIRDGEVQANPEVRGMPTRPAAHLLDPASLAKSMIEGCVESVRNETKSIEEVALSRAIGADEKNQRPKRDLAALDAAEVLQNDRLMNTGLCAEGISDLPSEPSISNGKPTSHGTRPQARSGHHFLDRG